MGITGVGGVGAINLFQYAQTGEQKLFREQKPFLRDNGVEVTISEEGMEASRKKVQEMNEGELSFDEMMAEREKLMEMNLSPMIDYDLSLCSMWNSYSEGKGYTPISERANDLMKAYTSFYDEIVQGYASGEREIRLQDDTSEKGYRVMTQEEELEKLNAAFKGCAEGLDSMAEAEENFKNAMKHSIQIFKKLGIMPSFCQKYLDSEYEIREKEVVPENITQTVLDAGAKFLLQYANADRSGQTKLLEDVKVFQ